MLLKKCLTIYYLLKGKKLSDNIDKTLNVNFSIYEETQDEDIYIRVPDGKVETNWEDLKKVFGK